jgi:hypothetical protein
MVVIDNALLYIVVGFGLGVITILLTVPAVMVIMLRLLSKDATKIQRVVAAAKGESPPPEPVVIPEEIDEYLRGESDAWAYEGRKARARELFADYGSWQRVQQELRRDDGEII